MIRRLYPDSDPISLGHRCLWGYPGFSTSFLILILFSSACCPESGDSRDAGSQIASGDGPALAFVPHLSVIQSEIFDRNCVTTCHENINRGAGLQLTPGKSYSNLVNQRSSRFTSQIRVVPGDPATSLLIKVLIGGTTAAGYIQMPKGASPRPQSEIDTIRTWITRGAPDD